MTQLATILLVQISAVSAMALNLPTVNLPLPTLGSEIRVTDLRCEYLCNPLGIDVMQPRLSWKLESQWRGQRQTAYEILVASNEELLKDNRADLWNTGKVTSDQSIQIAYSGRPLTSRTRCYWKVRVWDKDDKPSPFSEVATWEMGLLKPDDWQAKWITAPDDKPGEMPPARSSARRLSSRSPSNRPGSTSAGLATTNCT